MHIHLYAVIIHVNFMLCNDVYNVFMSTTVKIDDINTTASATNTKMNSHDRAICHLHSIYSNSMDITHSTYIM